LYGELFCSVNGELLYLEKLPAPARSAEYSREENTYLQGDASGTVRMLDEPGAVQAKLSI
jgi:hypothetical protein